MVITIKGILATLNDHDSANRANKFAGAALKKEQTELVAWQCKKYGAITNPVTIDFVWYYSTRHDFDNLAFAKKYCQDGLVKAGVLKDDSQKFVLGFSDAFIKVKKGQEKVVMNLIEYES